MLLCVSYILFAACRRKGAGTTLLSRIGDWVSVGCSLGRQPTSHVGLLLGGKRRTAGRQFPSPNSFSSHAKKGGGGGEILLLLISAALVSLSATTLHTHSNYTYTRKLPPASIFLIGRRKLCFLPLSGWLSLFLSFLSCIGEKGGNTRSSTQRWSSPSPQDLWGRQQLATPENPHTKKKKKRHSPPFVKCWVGGKEEGGVFGGAVGYFCYNRACATPLTHLFLLSFAG